MSQLSMPPSLDEPGFGPEQLLRPGDHDRRSDRRPAREHRVGARRCATRPLDGGRTGAGRRCSYTHVPPWMSNTTADHGTVGPSADPASGTVDAEPLAGDQLPVRVRQFVEHIDRGRECVGRRRGRHRTGRHAVGAPGGADSLPTWAGSARSMASRSPPAAAPAPTRSRGRPPRTAPPRAGPSGRAAPTRRGGCRPAGRRWGSGRRSRPRRRRPPCSGWPGGRWPRRASSWRRRTRPGPRPPAAGCRPLPSAPAPPA